MNDQRGITKVRIEGFKSIKDETIEIRPLTILAGANSSGKSSIMQPLLMMKQTLEAPRGGILEYQNFIFLRGDQAFSTLSDRFSTILYVSDSHGQNEFEMIFGLSSRGDGLKLYRNRYLLHDPHLALELPSGLEDTELYAYIPDFERLLKASGLAIEESEEITWSINRDHFFLIPTLYRKSTQGERNQVFQADILTSRFKNEIERVLYVTGKRDNTVNLTPLLINLDSNRFPGKFEDYTATILYQWQKIQHQSLKQLNKWLMALNLTSQITTKMQEQNQKIEILVGRALNSDLKDTVSLADVGIGVSHILPVLVALLIAEPSQLVYIEQPELHLHPHAQHELANIIVAAVKDYQVNLVIETHSDLLLRGVQTAVAREVIAKEKVMIHWFKRDAEGRTRITSGELNETGAYASIPVDFGEVDFFADSEYLKAVADRRAAMQETPG